MIEILQGKYGVRDNARERKILLKGLRWVRVNDSVHVNCITMDVKLCRNECLVVNTLVRFSFSDT